MILTKSIESFNNLIYIKKNNTKKNNTMKKTKFALSAIAMLVASSSFADNGKLLEINFTDEDGYGFYSVEPYDVEGNPAKTLGEARRNAFKHAVNVINTQFYSKNPIVWNVSFSSEVESIVNQVYYQEPLSNMEGEDTHYFFNPKVAGDTNQYERNIYTAPLYIAHGGEGETMNGNNSSFETFIPDTHTFELNDIEDSNSIFNFVNDSVINAFGFSVTNNIHKDSVEESENESESPDSEDKVREFHLSYFDKFLVDENGDSLYGKDFETVVSSVNSGVYFTGFSEETKSYIEYNSLIDLDSDLGIPMISKSEFVIEEPIQCELTDEDSENNGDSGEEDPNNGEECVEEDKDVLHSNIDMTFADHLSPTQQHSQSAPSVTNLGLSAYLLCDIGWCQTSSTIEKEFKGKVIDLELSLTSEEGSFLTNTNRNLDIKFEVASADNQYPVEAVVFEVAMPKDIAIDPLNDPLLASDACKISEVDAGSDEEIDSHHSIICTFDELTEKESFWLRLSSEDAGEHYISSRVYSNVSNIDSYGLNNLDYQKVSFVEHDKDNNSDDSEKSGGSFGFISALILAPLLFLRRRKNNL